MIVQLLSGKDPIAGSMGHFLPRSFLAQNKKERILQLFQSKRTIFADLLIVGNYIPEWKQKLDKKRRE